MHGRTLRRALGTPLIGLFITQGLWLYTGWLIPNEVLQLTIGLILVLAVILCFSLPVTPARTAAPPVSHRPWPARVPPHTPGVRHG